MKSIDTIVSGSTNSKITTTAPTAGQQQQQTTARNISFGH
jgi:hypothetical protein